ncbi:PPE family protein [Mycobacterium spongiae]|uniref:PPE domain-containing protein n=1 Tax=Mycobacterium spongiae TaxID=886343 RepID=A0A975JYA1_9MYCO|nr:PPE family protein [Mycobacterium spongiae]QUR67535.1 PPE domain-containing protein [Mycobacterium spongiae]
MGGLPGGNIHLDVNGSLDDLVKLINGVFPQLVDVFFDLDLPGLFAGLGTLLGSTDQLLDILAAAGPAFQEIADSAGSLATLAADAVGSFGPAVIGVGDFMSSLVSNSLVPLIPLIDAVGPLMDNVIGGFLTFSSTVSDVIIPLESAMFDNIITSIASLDDLSIGLSAFVRALGIRMDQTMLALSQDLGSFFQNLANMIAGEPVSGVPMMPAAAATDFGAVPPEITSAQMHTGPGPEPMMTAAAAWDGVAADADSTAVSIQSVVSELPDESWQGPTAGAMAAAAEPFVAWLNGVSAQAQQAAAQAQAAVSAFASAFAAIVPPPAIAANRAQLAALVATNIFGQNTAAIMATEAEYSEMWAQDATAMYGYAGAAAAATALSPFTSPPPTTTSTGPQDQADAVNQAMQTLGAAGSAPMMGATALFQAVPQALQGLAQPASMAPQSVGSLMQPAIGPASSAAMVAPGLASMGASSPGMGSVAPAMGPVAPAASSFVMPPAAPAGAGLTGGLGTSGLGSGGAGAMSASMGRAGSMGGLSVPPAWATGASTAGPAASVMPGTGMAGLGAAPAASAASEPAASTAAGVRMPGLTPVPANAKVSWSQPYEGALWNPKLA